MQRLLDFMEARVSRRVLFLFVVGAVVPVLVMAGLSYRAVRSQLLQQSQGRLEQLAETAGQSIVQRLLVVEQGLRRVSEAVAAGEDVAVGGFLPAEVSALGVQTSDGAWRVLSGAFPAPPPPLTPVQRAWVDRGGTVLTVESREPTRLLAAVPAGGPGAGSPDLVWAGLVGDSVWGAAAVFSSLPEVTGFCVLDAEGPLTCTGRGGAFASAVDPEADRRGTRQVSTSQGDHVVGYRQFFMAAAFATPPWAVLVAESVDGVYAPADTFAFSFLLALAVGVLTVLLLANVQVRRTLGPLQALEEGTRRISQGAFHTRVQHRSRDEFGALADSFNRMADELGAQFEQLEATAAIGQRVLTSAERTPVVREILERFRRVTPAGTPALLLRSRQSGHMDRLWWIGDGGTLEDRAIRLAPSDQRWLTRDGHDAGSAPEDPPLVAAVREETGAQTLRCLPFFNMAQVSGALLYDPGTPAEWPESAQERARQVVAQAALALHEIQLLEELDDMGLGTMRALARAIDAKSQWTAGHSERVTEMSIELAGVMGVADDQITILRRGGLLHDIGKIGIPSRVLDTKGPLSDEDWDLVRQHPTIGARILEPIGPFGEILPIVLQHHERWDGKGYPAGLRDDEIHPLARILAVADTYDAITSPRPYQASMAPAVAVAEILCHAGTQFDPAAADAFMTLMAAKGIRAAAVRS